MSAIPFLPVAGALGSHFLWVNLLARALHTALAGQRIVYIVSPSLTRLHLAFESEGGHSTTTKPSDYSPHATPVAAGITPATHGNPNHPPPAVVELNWSTDLGLLFWHPGGTRIPESYEKQLFPAWGQTVVGVKGCLFDRQIEIALGNGGALWIKWFGRTGNMLYHDGQRVHSVFRRSHQGDFQFTPPSEGRIAGDTSDLPPAYAQAIDAIWPDRAMGPGARKKTIAASEGVSPDEKRETRMEENETAIQLHKNNHNAITKQPLFDNPRQFLQWWRHSGVRIVQEPGKLPQLMPAVDPAEPTEPLLEACTRFARQYIASSAFHRNRQAGLERLERCRRQLAQKVNHLQAELQGLMDAGDYRRQANSLLTYPDRIAPNATVIQLPDCEQPDRMLKIRIDPGMSPPENAARLFAKSKRQHLQRANLEAQLHNKNEQLVGVRAALERMSAATDPRAWKEVGPYLRKLPLPPEILAALGSKNENAVRPGASGARADETGAAVRKAWHTHLIDGWEIWVGRDAAGNAELLRQAHKNDIWLHARGHSGSHVLIRCAGKSVPAPVMQKAAYLAARHSRGRGEEVCAVSHTRRKFVRPLKGGAPGKVHIDREEVIFSHPGDDADR